MTVDFPWALSTAHAAHRIDAQQLSCLPRLFRQEQQFSPQLLVDQTLKEEYFDTQWVRRYHFHLNGVKPHTKAQPKSHACFAPE